MRPALPLLLLLAACSVKDSYRITEDEAREYAEQRCRAAAECCEQAGPDCVNSTMASLLDLEEQAGASLTFSQECVSAGLAWIKTLGCERSGDLRMPDCLAASGSLEHGASCTYLGDLGLVVTPCAEGLQCVAGRCVDFPLPVTHPAQQGEHCEPFIPCDSGLFCGADNRCDTQRALGEACSDVRACSPFGDVYCAGVASGTGTCVATLGEGEPCGDEFTCGKACDAPGQCEPLNCKDGVCSLSGAAACGDY
jgi:hypothetical protein